MMVPRAAALPDVPYGPDVFRRIVAVAELVRAARRADVAVIEARRQVERELLRRRLALFDEGVAATESPPEAE